MSSSKHAKVAIFSPDSLSSPSALTSSLPLTLNACTRTRSPRSVANVGALHFGKNRPTKGYMPTASTARTSAPDDEFALALRKSEMMPR